LRQLAPVLLANVAAVQGGPVAAAGLLRGYSQAQQRKREEAEKQAALDAAASQSEEERNFKIAQARQSVMQSAAKFQADQQAKLSQFTNPAERASFIQSAERYAQQAFGIQPGWFQAPPLDTHAQDVKDAQAQLDLVRKTLGDNFNAAVAHHATTTFKGKRIPLGDLQALAGEDVTDPGTGQPFVAPTTPKSAADLVTGTGDFANIARGRIRAQEDKLGRPLTPEEANNLIFGAKRDIAGLSGSGSAGGVMSGMLNIPDIKADSKEFRIAQDLAYGRLTFSQFARLLPSRSGAAQTVKEAIYSKAAELNPGFNPSAFEAGYKLATNSRVQQQLTSLDNVTRGIPDLLTFSENASRSKYPIFNAAILKGGVALGGRRYSNFKTAVTAFADELSGALGYGSATDMSREMGFDMTNPNLSPQQFNSAILDVVKPFIERKRASLLAGMGIYGQPGASPAALPSPEPDSSALQAGDTFQVGKFKVRVK
jgi:hypothetical protein